MNPLKWSNEADQLFMAVLMGLMVAFGTVGKSFKHFVEQTIDRTPSTYRPPSFHRPYLVVAPAVYWEYRGVVKTVDSHCFMPCGDGSSALCEKSVELCLKDFPVMDRSR